jgi:hypothetical protein
MRQGRSEPMGILLISIIIFILIFASGYAGLHVQKRLADEHKTGESRGVVGQVAGLLIEPDVQICRVGLIAYFRPRLPRVPRVASRRQRRFAD